MAGQSALIRLVGTAVTSAAYKSQKEKMLQEATLQQTLSIDYIQPAGTKGVNGFQSPEEETCDIIEVAIKDTIDNQPNSVEKAMITQIDYGTIYSRLKPEFYKLALEYAVKYAKIDQGEIDRAIKKCDKNGMMPNTIEGAYGAILAGGYKKKPKADMQRAASRVSAEMLNKYKKYYSLYMCRFIKSFDDTVLKRIIGHFWNAEYHLQTGMSQIEISDITDGVRSSGYSSSAMFADQARIQEIYDYYVREKTYAEEAIADYKEKGTTSWFDDYTSEEMDEMMEDCICDNPALKII